MAKVKVVLRQSWFGPGAISYRVRSHEGDRTFFMEEEVAVLAPSTAKFFNEKDEKLVRVEGKFLTEADAEAAAKAKAEADAKKAVLANVKK